MDLGIQGRVAIVGRLKPGARKGRSAGLARKA